MTRHIILAIGLMSLAVGSFWWARKNGLEGRLEDGQYPITQLEHMLKYEYGEMVWTSEGKAHRLGHCTRPIVTILLKPREVPLRNIVLSIKDDSCTVEVNK